MLEGLAVLVSAQLLGEVAVRLAGLPVPGPVIGLVALGLALLVARRPIQAVEEAADGIVRHLSLLFVPAGVGVVQYAPLLRAEAIAIAATLVLSTAVTLAVTAFVFARLARGSSGTEGRA